MSRTTYRRPFVDRTLRTALAWLLPYPRRFRLALMLAGLARPFRGLFTGRIGAMLALAPAHPPRGTADLGRRNLSRPVGPRRARVALLTGCAQRVIAPAINEATIRLLNRHGVEVVVPRQAGCCGAIVHHIGNATQPGAQAVETIRAWDHEAETRGLDAIVINTSGCGTEIKDYGHLFRDDAVWAEPAAGFPALTRDISEYMAEIGLEAGHRQRTTGLTVAYHAACSLQLGQMVTVQP